MVLRWWTWPLPPRGLLEFICQLGTGETRVGIDAQLILDASQRSVRVWPEDETADTRAAPGDLRPQVAAHALIGVHRALLDYVHSRVLGGDDPAGLAAEMRKLTADAFELVEQGLRDYPAGPAATARGAG